jgi:phosphoglycerate dehydrogenase-like enzyme
MNHPGSRRASTPDSNKVARVLHYARTALARSALRERFSSADVEFVSIDDFDSFLREVDGSDLILLTDPGHERAKALQAVLEAASSRPRAIHILSAGRESFAGWSPPPHVVVTGVGGALAPTVAEHALALMLALRRGLHRFMVAQRWLPDDEAVPFLGTLEGANLLIIGCGRIGREVARRARPFGMHVTGANRSEVDHPAFDAIISIAELDAALPAAEIVVLCLPLADATRGLIGAERLRRFRPGALLINVGRGTLVEEDALVRALEDGSVGGAGLDVFAEEPLPPSSPLWRAPNTIITPHIAGLGGPGEAAIAVSARRALDDLLARRLQER